MGANEKAIHKKAKKHTKIDCIEKYNRSSNLLMYLFECIQRCEHENVRKDSK